MFFLSCVLFFDVLGLSLKFRSSTVFVLSFKQTPSKKTIRRVITYLNQRDKKNKTKHLCPPNSRDLGIVLRMVFFPLSFSTKPTNQQKQQQSQLGVGQNLAPMWLPVVFTTPNGQSQPPLQKTQKQQSKTQKTHKNKNTSNKSQKY